MSKRKRSVLQCKNGKEVIRHCRRVGPQRFPNSFEERKGKGPHTKFITRLGVLLVSPSSQGKGIMRKLVNIAIAVGLGVFVLYINGGL